MLTSPLYVSAQLFVVRFENVFLGVLEWYMSLAKIKSIKGDGHCGYSFQDNIKALNFGAYAPR